MQEQPGYYTKLKKSQKGREKEPNFRQGPRACGLGWLFSIRRERQSACAAMQFGVCSVVLIDHLLLPY